MQLLRTTKLIWTFYKSILFVSLTSTAFCLVLLWKYGFNKFGDVLWLKLATLALTWYFTNSFKEKEFYYYQNLGASKMLLWSATLIFDACLFILLTIQLSYIK